MLRQKASAQGSAQKAVSSSVPARNGNPEISRTTVSGGGWRTHQSLSDTWYVYNTVLQLQQL